jgi:sialic acid synthase SpsE
MADEFGVTIGYSDHTLGVLASFAAVALGARVIEKHFTLQKEGRTFRDHQLSADPGDMRTLTEGIKTVSQMLGDGAKAPAGSEVASSRNMRRSLAARVDIRAGTVITADQLTCLRPATGLPPSSLSQIVGRVALQDIPAGHHIPPETLTSSRASGNVD